MSKELDALVAEKVMGWAVLPEDDLGIRWWLDRDGRRLRDFEARPLYPPYPEYSTSISDAWLVVEEMEERDYVFSLWQIEVAAGYGVRFSPTKPGLHDSASGGADTAPEAICRAALETLA